jgi:transposase
MPRKSNDVRKLIVEAVKEGKSKKWIITTFKTTYETIISYLELDKQGKLNDIIRKGGVSSKVDMVKFKEYVDANPTKVGWEIGSVFNISNSWAKALVVKLGYSTKKTLQSTKKQDIKI